jgi:hypothetical protein
VSSDKERIVECTWQAVALHALLYPLYQIISTVRHELAHAIAARLSGLTVTEIRVLPCRRDGRWYWGYVRWEGTANVHCYRAPYYVNAACLPVGVWLALDPPAWSLHAWVVAIVLLLVSPIVDTLYNLLKWRFYGRGDFAVVSDLERNS